MRFIAEAASTEVDLRQERFAPEALYQMAEAIQGKEIPILGDFNQHLNVGFVDSAKVVDNKLIIEGDILGSYVPKSRTEGYVVPGYQVRENSHSLFKGCRFISTDVKLVCFGLTDKPSDSSLTPLREMEFKKCVVG